MKISTLLEYSAIFQYILAIWGYYRRTEDRINSIYLNSFCHNLLSICKDGIKIVFRYSIFGRITEVNENSNVDILGHSIVVKRVMKLFEELKDRLYLYFNESRLAGFTGVLSVNFENRPLKTGGLIVIIALAVNSILIAALGKEVNTFGIALRIALFLIAMACSFSNTDWHSVKESSFFIKKI